MNADLGLVEPIQMKQLRQWVAGHEHVDHDDAEQRALLGDGQREVHLPTKAKRTRVETAP